MTVELNCLRDLVRGLRPASCFLLTFITDRREYFGFIIDDHNFLVNA